MAELVDANSDSYQQPSGLDPRTRSKGSVLAVIGSVLVRIRPRVPLDVIRTITQIIMAQSVTTIRVNTSYVPLAEEEDGDLLRRTELIFVTSEPEYELSNDHEVMRKRTCQTHRLDVGKQGLKNIIEICEDLLEEYEEDPYTVDA